MVVRTVAIYLHGARCLYPPIADYRCNVAVELDGTQIHSRRLVASTDYIAEAADARGDRLSQQNGTDDVGDADENADYRVPAQAIAA